jgi:hypothetical protein
LRLPSDVAAQLSFEPGERQLAWGRSADGRWYVGTNRAVHLPDREGFRAVPWEHVARAEWQSDVDRLTIVEIAEEDTAETRIEVQLEDPGRLLEVLRERISKSLVYSAYTPVRGRSGLSVVGRRPPSGDGPVTWRFVVSAGLDLSDPDVAVAAQRALRQAEAEMRGL